MWVCGARRMHVGLQIHMTGWQATLTSECGLEAFAGRARCSGLGSAALHAIGRIAYQHDTCHNMHHCVLRCHTSADAVLQHFRSEVSTSVKTRRVRLP